MSTLLLLSIVLATIGIPMVAARDRSAVRATKKTAIWVIAFTLFYFLALRYLFQVA